MMTTFRTRLVSLRPSGLAESPLLRIGLVLRLLAAELAAELLVDAFSRFGMIRTMLKDGGTRERRRWWWISNWERTRSEATSKVGRSYSYSVQPKARTGVRVTRLEWNGWLRRGYDGTKSID